MPPTRRTHRRRVHAPALDVPLPHRRRRARTGEPHARIRSHTRGSRASSEVNWPPRHGSSGCRGTGVARDHPRGPRESDGKERHDGGREGGHEEGGRRQGDQGTRSRRNPARPTTHTPSPKHNFWRQISPRSPSRKSSTPHHQKHAPRSPTNPPLTVRTQPSSHRRLRRTMSSLNRRMTTRSRASRLGPRNRPRMT